jgi:fluoride exporter
VPVIVGVALGGALGAAARYSLDRFIEQRSESIFPWSVFTINVTGCFLVGLLTETLVDRHHLPAWLRVGVVLGVIGGYTTFSTFAQDAVDLNDHVSVAAVYLVASVGLGMAAVVLGRHVGRLVP